MHTIATKQQLTTMFAIIYSYNLATWILKWLGMEQNFNPNHTYQVSIVL